MGVTTSCLRESSNCFSSVEILSPAVLVKVSNSVERLDNAPSATSFADLWVSPSVFAAARESSRDFFSASNVVTLSLRVFFSASNVVTLTSAAALAVVREATSASSAVLSAVRDATSASKAVLSAVKEVTVASSVAFSAESEVTVASEAVFSSVTEDREASKPVFSVSKAAFVFSSSWVASSTACSFSASVPWVA